jgi:tetratricopeptide (TPR) repeat protein
MTLGQAFARSGDDEQALIQLRKAVSFSVAGQETDAAQETSMRALALVNTSMVLRRLGQIEEALELASQAVRIEEGIRSDAEPYLLAGAGWAYAALALAQTDLAQDGRLAASDSLRIFRLLDQDGVFATGEGEGYAFACYTKAYASHRFQDSEAEEFAHEAVDRFAQLHATTPNLYQRRLHEAEQLLAVVLASQPAR